MRPRSPAGAPRSGPGSRGGAEARRVALLPGRVRLLVAPAGAAHLGAAGADADPAAPLPLEAGVDGGDLLLPARRVAGAAVLPHPARQLQRPHPDRRAQAAAPLPARRARDLDPVEGLWANLKDVELANLCRDTIAEVLDAAWQGIARVRRESTLLFSFLRYCGLEL